MPQIAKTAGQLHLYQRTANWVVPKANTPYPAEQLQHFRDNPAAVKQSRDDIYDTWNTLCTFQQTDVLAAIEKQGMDRIAEVFDPETREKLPPPPPFGRKRPLVSNVY